MKNDRFKDFLEYVGSASKTDPIWWAGYLWIDLTKRQATKTIEVLKNRPDCKLDVVNGRDVLKIPSGLAIYIEQ